MFGLWLLSWSSRLSLLHPHAFHLAASSPRSSISSSSFLDRWSTSATPMQSPRTLTVVLQRSLKDTNHRAEDMRSFTLCCLISGVAMPAKSNLQQPFYSQQKGSVPRRNPNDCQNEESGSCSCSWDPCFSYAGHRRRHAAEETQRHVTENQITTVDRWRRNNVKQHHVQRYTHSSNIMGRVTGGHCIYPLSSYIEREFTREALERHTREFVLNTIMFLKYGKIWFMQRKKWLRHRLTEPAIFILLLKLKSVRCLQRI